MMFDVLLSGITFQTENAKLMSGTLTRVSSSSMNTARGSAKVRVGQAGGAELQNTQLSRALQRTK